MQKSPLPRNKIIQDTTPTCDSNSKMGRSGVSTNIKLIWAPEAVPSLTHLTDLTEHLLYTDIGSSWAQPKMRRLLHSLQSFVPDREARQLQPYGKGLWLGTQDEHPARNCMDVCRCPREQWLSYITPELGIVCKGGESPPCSLATWLRQPTLKEPLFPYLTRDWVRPKACDIWHGEMSNQCGYCLLTGCV